MNDEEVEAIRKQGIAIERKTRRITITWTLAGALFFAALVLAGGTFLVLTARATRDEVRCLIQAQARVEREQRRFVIAQHRRLIALAVEIARREGVPTKGLEDLRSPALSGDNGSEPRDSVKNPPPPRDDGDTEPRPRPSPRETPCLVEVGGNCILPSPTSPLALAAVEVKDAPRDSCARE